MVWAVVAAAHTLYFSVVTGKELVAEGERLAWREGELPALRGRILDRDGVPLAWTELYNDLLLAREPERESRRRSLDSALEAAFGRLVPQALESGLLLKRSLSPEELLAAYGLLREFPELRIVPRVERRCIDYPDVRRRIGRTGVDGARMSGSDGLEGSYDAKLRGRPGRFMVMLDRSGNWVEGTLKIVERPQMGGDVSVAFSLAEAGGGNGRGDDGGML